MQRSFAANKFPNQLTRKLAFDTPCQKMTTGQFWPVVAANRLRHAALGDDRL
jgi:hypothetical protein